jgi:hypothetical protein
MRTEFDGEPLGKRSLGRTRREENNTDVDLGERLEVDGSSSGR